MLKDNQIKILMLVHELEKTLAEIYELFAEKFPEHTTLWQTLIKEEQEHAEAVRKLYKLTYERQASFAEGIIKVEGVQSIIDYAKSVGEAAKLGKFTALQALTKAHEIEKSLIEREIFGHFRVSSQFTDMLRYLHDGSQNHVQLTKNELDKAARHLTKQKG